MHTQAQYSVDVERPSVYIISNTTTCTYSITSGVCIASLSTISSSIASNTRSKYSTVHNSTVPCLMVERKTVKK